jgi:hypothetical protein
MNNRVHGWLQKPRTVNRSEEVRQQVVWGNWHGSEIGKQHKFLSSEGWASKDCEWQGEGVGDPSVDGVGTVCWYG